MKTFVCRCEDVTLHELEAAMARGLQGHRVGEALHRASARGGARASGACRSAPGSSTSAGGRSTSPSPRGLPYHPVPLAVLAGLADLDRDARGATRGVDGGRLCSKPRGRHEGPAGPGVPLRGRAPAAQGAARPQVRLAPRPQLPHRGVGERPGERGDGLVHRLPAPARRLGAALRPARPPLHERRRGPVQPDQRGPGALALGPPLALAPGLERVTVFETADARCEYEGH